MCIQIGFEATKFWLFIDVRYITRRLGRFSHHRIRTRVARVCAFSVVIVIFGNPFSSLPNVPLFFFIHYLAPLVLIITVISEIKKGVTTKKVHIKAKQILSNNEHKSILHKVLG